MNNLQSVVLTLSISYTLIGALLLIVLVYARLPWSATRPLGRPRASDASALAPSGDARIARQPRATSPSRAIARVRQKQWMQVKM